VTKTKSEELTGIDYVFPYVTMDDQNWQSLYKKYYHGNDTDWKAGFERYRDIGMVKYVLRSIATHLPFVRNVYIIVMFESQIPAWLNRKNVKIIYHRDFIPKKYLPTFNSSTLELFLALLPLNGRFIYANDDMITFKDLTKEFFFRDGIPIYNIKFRNFRKLAPADPLRLNAYNFVFGKNQKKRVVLTQHGPISYRMDWLKEFHQKYGNVTSTHATMFREDDNYNHFIYSLWQMKEKKIVNLERDIVTYAVRKKSFDQIIHDDFESHDFMCINDSAFSTEEQWNKLLQKIDRLLPNKSKYEN